MPTARVCHISFAIPYFDDRILARECQALAEAGYQVHLLAPEGSQRVLGKIALGPAPKCNGIGMFQTRRAARQILYSALDLDADIYHLHGPQTIALGSMLLRQGRAVVYESREITKNLILHSTGGGILANLKAWAFQSRERRFTRHAMVVIGATSAVRDYFTHYGCLAIDVSDYPSLENLPAVPAYGSREGMIAYEGDLTEKAGLFLLLQAVERLDCSLYLIGEFGSRKVERAARSMPAWSKVTLVDPYKPREVSEALAKSKAGILVPETTESFGEQDPIQFSHFMHAGLPVICANFSAWKELIIGEQCGFCIERWDLDEVSGMIQWVLEHPKEAESAGENAKRVAAKRYLWKTEQGKLLDIYTKVLEACGAGQSDEQTTDASDID